MYFRTVRGEIRTPSLSTNSLAIAMRRINWRSSSEISGRPGHDSQRHSSRPPARCQRTSVSERTITSAERQLTSLASKTKFSRVAASIRRGLHATLFVQRQPLATDPVGCLSRGLPGRRYMCASVQTG